MTGEIYPPSSMADNIPLCCKTTTMGLPGLRFHFMMSCGEVETTLPSQELNSLERLDNFVEFPDWRRAWQVDVSGVTLLGCGAVGGS